MPTFKVQVYSIYGSILPTGNEKLQFLQSYFMGESQKEVNQRCQNLPDVRPHLVMELQEFPNN